MVKRFTTPPPPRAFASLRPCAHLYLQDGERFNGLDGIRAYAALGIVLLHVLSNICVKPTDCYLTRTIIPFFSDFTLLFMMVSAFSMCCGYYEKIKTGAITPNAFYKKRYIRILPFFALLNFVDLAVSPSWKSVQDIYANLTLAFNLLPAHDTSVIGVGWFLGIIFVFYMLFPFFVFLIDTKKRAWLTMAAATLLLFIAFTRFGHPTRHNIVYCFPYFLVGGLIYHYREKIEHTVQRVSLVSSVTVIFSVVCYFALRPLIPSVYISYSLELLFFAVIVIYAVGGRSVSLNNPIVKYLSGISMEIYLCHMVMFRVVERVHIERFITEPNTLYVTWSLAVIAGAVIFSHCFKIVEKRIPFLK